MSTPTIYIGDVPHNATPTRPANEDRLLRDALEEIRARNDARLNPIREGIEWRLSLPFRHFADVARAVQRREQRPELSALACLVMTEADFTHARDTEAKQHRHQRRERLAIVAEMLPAMRDYAIANISHKCADAEVRTLAAAEWSARKAKRGGVQ